MPRKAKSNPTGQPRKRGRGSDGDKEVPPRAGLRWTLEDDRTVIGMRNQNTPYEAIGKNLGKTPLACRLHMHNLNGRAKAAADARHKQFYADNPHAPRGGPVVGSSDAFPHVFGSGQMAPGLATFRPIEDAHYPAQEVTQVAGDPQPTLRPLLPAPSTGRATLGGDDQRRREVMDAVNRETQEYWLRVAGALGTTANEAQRLYATQIQSHADQQSFSAQRPYATQIQSHADPSLTAYSAGNNGLQQLINAAAHLGLEAEREAVSPRTRIAPPPPTWSIPATSCTQNGTVFATSGDKRVDNRRDTTIPRMSIANITNPE